MSSKLIITPYQNGIMTGVYEDMKPAELHFSHQNQHCQVGDVYIARVKNVVPNIQAAFLDLGNEITGYLPLKEEISPIYTKKGTSARIQQGDELLVQIKKEAVKSKDLAVTTEISLSSVYFVGILQEENIHISGKLSKKEKERLYHWVKEKNLGNLGLIVRTAAATASISELDEDLSRLLNRCEQLLKIAPFRTFGSCMLKSPPEYVTLLKNYDASSISQIITDQKEYLEEIQEFLTNEHPSLLDKLRYYEDRLLPLEKLYCMDSAVKEALSQRIWLKSGGYLVIQETEALTVVDVNTGKYNGKKDLQETFFKINREAAQETARQLRLRNLSGIIIVDFINMKDEYQKPLLKELQTHLDKDHTPARVMDITALGLVEITRKRSRGTISEQMFLKKYNTAD